MRHRKRPRQRQSKDLIALVEKIDRIRWAAIQPKPKQNAQDAAQTTIENEARENH